jgi:DNA-binding MarR family transcriptional regulator
MSSGTSETRAERLRELAQALRQLGGVSAALLRTEAARSGMTAADAQVIDLLRGAGPTTAGQLADLTGLTTGAITQLLTRQEEAGRIRRERDPEDGRRVIVRLAAGADEARDGDFAAGPFGRVWDELASQYDDEQLATLLKFLTRCNALAAAELVRLREAPETEMDVLSAPLGDVTSGRLFVSAGASRLTVKAGHDLTALYQAHFEGTTPEVKVAGGEVSIRYPRRLWARAVGRSADVGLNTTIPWRIELQANGSEVNGALDGLDVAELEVKGNGSMLHLDLPAPSGVVLIRILGAGSEIAVTRPAGVAFRVRAKGWGSMVTLDGMSTTGAGGTMRLQTPDYEAANQRYDVEVSCTGSMVTVTAT